LRDQAHTAAGLTCLRFTHAQVKYDRRHVHQTLLAVAERLLAAQLPLSGT
jgi:very-short-patch-repair endonuclease